LNRKLIIIILVLLMAGAVNGFVLRGTKQVGFDIGKIPLLLNGWKGMVIQSDALTRKILETNDVYDIQYSKGASRLQLSIVYYPEGQPAFHMPEGCVVGVGERVDSEKMISVDGAWGRSQMVYMNVLNGSGQAAYHLYAFATMEKLYGDLIKFRFHLLSLGIRRNIQACALIRLSAYQADSSIDAESELKSFWSQISIYLKNEMNRQPADVRPRTAAAAWK
jgi:Protein of unknown function (DUF3485)